LAMDAVPSTLIESSLSNITAVGTTDKLKIHE
jgi:hypothetical protein